MSNTPLNILSGQLTELSSLIIDINKYSNYLKKRIIRCQISNLIICTVLKTLG